LRLRRSTPETVWLVWLVWTAATVRRCGCFPLFGFSSFSVRRFFAWAGRLGLSGQIELPELGVEGSQGVERGESSVAFLDLTAGELVDQPDDLLLQLPLAVQSPQQRRRPLAHLRRRAYRAASEHHVARCQLHPPQHHLPQQFRVQLTQHT